jgi:hypothetical protein
VFVYVVQLCLESYLINPFDVTRPREFLYWSVIITLRCCLLETVFGVNGIYDAVMSVAAPALAIFGMTFKLEFEGKHGVTFVMTPIIFTLVGGFLFNYIVSAEQRRLFMLERFSTKQKGE